MPKTCKFNLNLYGSSSKPQAPLSQVWTSRSVFCGHFPPAPQADKAVSAGVTKPSSIAALAISAIVLTCTFPLPTRPINFVAALDSGIWSSFLRRRLPGMKRRVKGLDEQMGERTTIFHESSNASTFENMWKILKHQMSRPDSMWSWFHEPLNFEFQVGNNCWEHQRDETMFLPTPIWDIREMKHTIVKRRHMKGKLSVFTLNFAFGSSVDWL